MSSHAHSNLVFANVTIYFFLLSDVINVKNGYDVKRSALEKICWDENVQLKWLHDLSAFVVCCLFLLALDCVYLK